MRKLVNEHGHRNTPHGRLACLILFGVSIALTFPSVATALQTVEVQVNSRNDDAEENSSGSVRLTSSDLELVLDGSDQAVGMRFYGITVPQGATISNAYIQFQVDETNSGATSLTIQGQATDNAPAFTSANGNISSRARTTASVAWSPAPWTTVGVAGPDQQTPDIAPVIQEIVDRSGWSSGNALPIIVTGDGERTAESFDGVSAAAPLLHVEYDPTGGGGPINQAPGVNAGSDQTNAEGGGVADAVVTKSLQRTQNTTFYVDRNHPASSDRNPGTEQLPWKTIVHAAAVAGAGDTVLIKAGIYEDGDVVVANSGAPGLEITFAAYPGDERKAAMKGGTFRSVGNSHIAVRGLEIRESPRHGFRFEGPENPNAPPAGNIILSGNHTYDTCSSGISIWGVPWGEDPGDYNNIRDVIIEDNLLELGTHGCKGEVITVANGAVNVTVRNNEIRLGDPAMEGGDEGIDFKEGVTDSSIYGNYIHHLSDKAIYIDGGSDARDPLISNIHIYNNFIMELPSAGIVVTTEGKGDVDGVYVYNNIVAHVDGDGFRVYDHPGGNAAGGIVENVYFINNTATDTGRVYGGGFRVNHATATGIVFRNNIAWDNGNYDLRVEDETLQEANLCSESFCSIQKAPQFVDAGNDDYRLQVASPAIDAGLSEETPSFDILGVPRPQGVEIDIGAHEYE